MNPALQDLIITLLTTFVTFFASLLTSAVIKFRANLKKELEQRDLDSVLDIAEPLILRIQKEYPEYVGELKHQIVKESIKKLLPKLSITDEMIDNRIHRAYEGVRESERFVKAK